MESENSMMHLS
jgi:oligoendopeptidase F